MDLSLAYKHDHFSHLKVFPEFISNYCPISLYSCKNNSPHHPCQRSDLDSLSWIPLNLNPSKDFHSPKLLMIRLPITSLVLSPLDAPSPQFLCPGNNIWHSWSLHCLSIPFFPLFPGCQTYSSGFPLTRLVIPSPFPNLWMLAHSTHAAQFSGLFYSLLPPISVLWLYILSLSWRLPNCYFIYFYTSNLYIYFQSIPLSWTLGSNIQLPAQYHPLQV